MSSAGAAVAVTATKTTASTTSTTTIVTTTIPMVTVYTAPASCSSSWTYEASTYNGITSGILLQNAISVDTDCFPPGFQQNGRVLANQVFSPGACPDRYSTQQFVVSNAITTATCCLSDFSLYAASGYVGCISAFTGATKVAARAGGFTVADSTTGTSISGTYTMWGMPIVVEVQSTDRSLFPTAASTSATTTTSATATSSTSSSSQSATLTAVSSSSTGLSSGAKAGIGVGVAVGALLILGFLAFWLRRRRKAQAPSGLTTHMKDQAPSGLTTQHSHEIQGLPVSELHADPRKSNFPISELPS